MLSKRKLRRLLAERAVECERLKATNRDLRGTNHALHLDLHVEASVSRRLGAERDRFERELEDRTVALLELAGKWQS